MGSSILVVFHFNRLPFWSSSILVVFHFGRLPFCSSCILFVFNFGRLQFWSSFIFVVFHLMDKDKISSEQDCYIEKFKIKRPRSWICQMTGAATNRMVAKL